MQIRRKIYSLAIDTNDGELKLFSTTKVEGGFLDKVGNYVGEKTKKLHETLSNRAPGGRKKLIKYLENSSDFNGDANQVADYVDLKNILEKNKEKLSSIESAEERNKKLSKILGKKGTARAKELVGMEGEKFDSEKFEKLLEKKGRTIESRRVRKGLEEVEKANKAFGKRALHGGTVALGTGVGAAGGYGVGKLITRNMDPEEDSRKIKAIKVGSTLGGAALGAVGSHLGAKYAFKKAGI